MKERAEFGWVKSRSKGLEPSSAIEARNINGRIDFHCVLRVGIDFGLGLACHQLCPQTYKYCRLESPSNTFAGKVVNRLPCTHLKRIERSDGEGGVWLGRVTYQDPGAQSAIDYRYDTFHVPTIVSNRNRPLEVFEMTFDKGLVFNQLCPQTHK